MSNEPLSMNTGGLAADFVRELNGAWDAFPGMETMAPLAELQFEDGRSGWIADLPDVPLDILRCLSEYVEFPHTGWVPCVGIPWNSRSFEMGLAFEGIDGPLIVRFADESLLTYQVALPKPVPESMRNGDNKEIQSRVEAVVGLIGLTNIHHLFERDDRRTADALTALLAELATVESPPRSIVREAVRWFAGKLDKFSDAAAESAGKAAGMAAVGTVGLVAWKYLPGLREQLERLKELMP